MNCKQIFTDGVHKKIPSASIIGGSMPRAFVPAKWGAKGYLVRSSFRVCPVALKSLKARELTA
jgi:hypothetical protein